MEKTIELEREILDISPEGHPGRHDSLSNLAISLHSRFKRYGRIEDLEDAIKLERSALDLRPQGHPDRHHSTHNLAVFLFSRFMQGERIEDIEESIGFGRVTLALLTEYVDRHRCISNLAVYLTCRFARDREIGGLEEAINLVRDCLDHSLNAYGGLRQFMDNLTVAQRHHSKDESSTEGLEIAMKWDVTALDLLLDNNPDLHNLLTYLAVSLRGRFEHGKRIEDINEAIELEYLVLGLLPGGHPDRHFSLEHLAFCLWLRFENYGENEDLEGSIKLHHAALDLCPEGHPLRSRLLTKLTHPLHSRFQSGSNSEDLEECVRRLRCASVHISSSYLDRFRAAQRWVKLARSHDHVTTLEAYRTAMSLMQRVLAFAPTASERHKRLSSEKGPQSLALDAGSYAIGKGDLTGAIELIEQGRALLWSQMRGFRTTLDRVKDVDRSVAERFKHCSRRLETLMTSTDFQSSGKDGAMITSTGIGALYHIDEMLVQVRLLSEEQEGIIEEIRRIPGFEDFLRTASFRTLHRAASEGPVVVLNYSKHRCDALIIFSREDEPCCVPLDADLFQDATTTHDELIEARKKFGVGSDAYDEILRGVMKFLWDRVVSKVVKVLRDLGIREGSRIWWCPTSVLSTLPFHAAGPYKDANGHTKYLLDDYISSYTPTLKSLIDARSEVRNEKQRILFVGDSTLASAKRERCAIGKYKPIDRHLVDIRATCSAVLEALRDTEWVHFACHGKLDKDPFRSSFKLSGDGLTLLDIIRTHLPNAEFAFLSACHTAEQAPDAVLDEVLHLSAAIQFCGFRSVIGTMWEILDRDGPPLSECIYAHLMGELRDGEIRFKRAAAAVREAALRWKDQRDYGEGGTLVDIHAERWVNLVHIGA